jgi:hypothetical protein
MQQHPQQYRPFAGGYVSEFDQFMNTYLAKKPQVVEDRQRGWYLWWDHRVDLDELDKQRESSVPEKPYHYE